jgi:ribose transport system substrate-binding protein/inositol transport system substrate-binding protein
MSILKRSSVLAGAFGLALMAFTPVQAQEELTILESVPGLNFPFFVHMMNQMKAEAESLGGITVIESDGQDSTPKQTADVETAIVQGVDGIVISPREVDAMAPAIQQAVDAGIPVVTIDRRVDKVPGILAHVGADNVKGGEAQGELIMKLFPDGATIINLQGTPGASPAIDRSKGLHNVLDPHADKYKFVFEQTANFRRADGLSVTESALGGMDEPPDVIVAGNDDMIFGAIEALKARNIDDVVTLGFDALPEALVQVRDGTLTATVEQFPGGQSRGAVDTLVAFLRDGKKPDQQVTLLTPIAITKDNLDQAERLDEAK